MDDLIFLSLLGMNITYTISVRQAYAESIENSGRFGYVCVKHIFGIRSASGTGNRPETTVIVWIVKRIC